MDTATAQRLADMTSQFYAAHAATFSATRAHPWKGWERCLSHVAVPAAIGGSEAAPEHLPGEASAEKGNRIGLENDLGSAGCFTVLDLACGNLRFEHFAQDYFANRLSEGAVASPEDCGGINPATPALMFYAVDNCVFPTQQTCGSLASKTAVDRLSDFNPALDNVRFQKLDILDGLFAGTLTQDICAPLCGLVVCFGFMHHIPGYENRIAFLRAMVDAAAPGGLIALSLWRFMDDPRLSAKAEQCDSAALALLKNCVSEGSSVTLEEGDHFLDWQNNQDVFRYCHHFSNGEIVALLDEIGKEVTLVDQFDADGKTGSLNRYIVLKKK